MCKARMMDMLDPTKEAVFEFTTGAGDSFWGGVLCSILSINKPVEKMEWEEIRKCAVLGNAVAGLCVQKRGGIPAIPTKEAVFEFMQK